MAQTVSPATRSSPPMPLLPALSAAIVSALALTSLQAATQASEAPPVAVIAPTTVATPLGATTPAAAPVREVRETLHGVEVVDPYRWMEDVASPETQAFFRAQDEHARAALKGLPGREAMLARIRELSEGGVSITRLAMAGNRVFYARLSPGLSSPVLCVREGFKGAERVLIDPATLAKDGAAASIDWYHPSPDGRLIAYGLSHGGTEDSTLRVMDVGTGKDLGLEIDRTRFNSALGWHPDSKSFYYARIPEGGPKDPARRFAGVRIYRHVIGRPVAQNEVVFAAGRDGARDVPDLVYPSIVVPEEGTHAYAIARHGVRREMAVYESPLKALVSGKPQWTKIISPEDGVTAMAAWKDDLYLLTHNGASRYRMLHAKSGKLDVKRARTIVPEGDAVILSFALAADGIYLRTTVGGLERLERLNFAPGSSKTPEFLKTAFDVAISQIVAHPKRPGAVLRMQGFIEAPAVVTVAAKTGDIANTGLQPPPMADFSKMDEVRLYCPSHDGTRVPVTLLYKATTMLSADNPTLLIGYGAYGISQVPFFDPTRLAWLERGGIIAIAHIRGGGEYGEAWHQAGQKATKENTILDFIACAEFLIKYGFTSPQRLAIQGTSAGGIPAGGAMVRRTDLFAAVVPRVAVLDMLRFEFAANGPANIPEFGSVATPEGFEALRKMSAYHAVKDGENYPAVLLTTGMNDPRVDPWQAGKMAARLQAASRSGNPVLTRVEWKGGHGMGASRAQREEELADIYSFLLWRFGEEAFTPKPGTK